MTHSMPASTPFEAVGPVNLNPYDLQSCMLESRRVGKLSEAALLDEFVVTLSRDRGNTVRLLIQMGAIESRALHRSRAYDSMYTWCTEALHMSEGTAYKRIRAARVAHRFPAVLPMLADGRLHLSAVVLLAPHLTRQNVASLLSDATHLSKAAVERLVAERFPKPDVPTAVRALADPSARPPVSATAQVVANISAQLSPGTVDPASLVPGADPMGPLLSAHDDSRAVQEVMAQALGEAAAKCGHEPLPPPVLAALAGSLSELIVNAASGVTVEAAAPISPPADSPARITPRSAGRFAWQLTADQGMQELFEEARQLLGHEAPGGDLKAVLRRGLEVLVQVLRKQKCAATSKPREPRAQRLTASGRYVPRSVVREVVARDGGQCTFVSPDGRRCTARSNLQLDHVIPFARRGSTTADNLRQLCAPHNQHEAERLFGAEHMRSRRADARAGAERSRRAKASARATRTGAGSDVTRHQRTT